MNKDFNDFRKLINDNEIVASIIEKSPLFKGVTLHFEDTPEGLEQYHKELTTAVVSASMVATVDFLQVYHQWVSYESNKDE